jgi:hypothetical protein
VLILLVFLDAQEKQQFVDKDHFVAQCRQAQYIAKCVDGTVSFLFMGDCSDHGGQAMIFKSPDS